MKVKNLKQTFDNLENTAMSATIYDKDDVKIRIII